MTNPIEPQAEPVGRPLKFPTKEDLEEKIAEFWAYVELKKVRPTMTRLALFLDCDRKTITNYAHTDEFFPTIKRVRGEIEADKHEALFDRAVPTAGVIFDLTNNGQDWQNKQFQDNTQRISGSLDLLNLNRKADEAKE
jgi:hypothetical protein